MNHWQEKVGAFRRGTGQLLPLEDSRELRANLILEEAVETVAALGFEVVADLYEASGLGHIAAYERGCPTLDLPSVIDGVCDSIYVLLGTAEAAGIDIDPFFAEVHRANMTKLDGPKRADGKQLKPEGWQPPRIEAMLEELGHS